tara:strand:- start:131 stop:1585 length:1455 start_codon:yes stop_codon:yes gene_type:complete
MDSYLILFCIISYFIILILVSHFTSKSQDNKTFFIANKKSPWYIVAFGMIGASLSGVTFISIPGWVAESNFSYMQMVFGYFFGYVFISEVLMPLYYKLNLVSIYTYLGERFGVLSYKTGSFYFIVSRLIGASFRLFLVAEIFHFFVFKNFGIPFYLTVLITVMLIWVYTFRGGLKTIIWTDTLQTFFMLLALFLSIILISKDLNFGFKDLVFNIKNSYMSKIFFFEDINDSRHFVKQFFTGVFICIAMTGLDQDMMQKNLSCKNIKDAKKNMYSFSVVLIVVNFLFLSLGALLYIYAAENSMNVTGDQLFPSVALSSSLSGVVGIFFILGLIAAAYSSADSALTSLTTTFSIDFIKINNIEKKRQVLYRKLIHVVFSFLIFLLVVLFELIEDNSIVAALFKAAGYTYGPLLGLYFFGLFTKLKVKDKFVPFVCLFSPVFCFFLNKYSEYLFNYKFGFEILILNGILTFIGLVFISNFKEKYQKK